MAARWTTAVIGALLAAISLEAAGPSQAGRPDAGLARCRPVGDPAKLLLQDAVRRSPSVGALLAEIERSDVIAFVVISPEPGVWRGDTRLTSESGKPRMLRVTLNNDLAPDERIGVLAHELQHVVEIAGAPDVVDPDSMRRFFKRIGYLVNSTGNRYETRAAQQIENRVRQEITRSR